MGYRTMRRRQSSPKYEVLLVIVYIILLAVFCLLNFKNGESPDLQNLLICGIQFVITGIIFAFTIFKYFRRTNKMVMELQNVSDEIRANSINTSSQITFQNKLLSMAFGNYQEDIGRLKTIYDGKTFCDVEEYINDNLVDDSINKGLLSLVPGTMTGLGILGTFIGLTLGLQFFNTGTAEEISNSIAPLMDGIKVAFHTSIFGMVFSLTFNYVYKKKLGIAYFAIENFLAVFRNKVSPKPENELMSRLVEYQDNQMQMASQLAENVGESIAQKMAVIFLPEFEKLHISIEYMQSNSDLLGKTLNDTLKDILVPQFAEMNKTIERFAMTASQAQVEGVQEIVGKFVEEMNASLGDNFKELGDVLGDTCELQKEQSIQIKEIIKRTDNMIDHLLAINDLTKSTIEEMQGYVSRMEELQDSVNRSMDTVQEQTKVNNALLAEHQRYLEELMQYESKLSQSSSQFLDEVGLQMAKLQNLEETISDKTNEQITVISNSALSYTNLMKKQCDILSDSAERHFKVISDSVSEYNDKLEQQISDSLSTIKQIETDIQTASKENIAEIHNTVKEQCRILAESARKNIEEILNLKGQTSADLQRTSSQLNEVLTKLNWELQEVLNKTFDSFDINLQEITHHLSGTIAQVESTTDNVPKIVEAAYEGLDKSFEKMQLKMDKLVSQVEELGRVTEARINLIKDEY